jgi:hypothetical protein
MSGTPVLVKRLSEFPRLTSLTGAEDIPCVSSGNQYRIKSSQLVTGGTAGPGLYGPLTPYNHSNISYSITSYDMVVAPVASVDHGTLTQNGPNLIYNAGSYAGPVLFTIGTATFNVTILSAVINAPVIEGFTSPIAVNTPLLYLNYSAFATTGFSDTLASVEIQYDTVSTFDSANLTTKTTLAANVSVDTVTRIIGIELGPLLINTTYYLRVRYTGAVLSASTWSATVVLNTAAQFVANNIVANLLDPNTGVKFAFSVAMDSTGTLCAVGDYGATVAGGGNGKVYIYTKTGNTWALSTTLTGNSTASGFGYTVALSADGTVLVAGDYNAYNGVVSANTGSVYIFTNTAGTWAQSFFTYGTVASANFSEGLAISHDGKTVAVGCNYGATGNTVLIYTLTAGTWSNTSSVSTADPIFYFGASLSLNQDGTVLVVGANNYYNGSGSVYTFFYSNAAWTQTSKITDPANNTAGSFGGIVALNAQATVLVIISTNSNLVYIAQSAGSNTWAVLAIINPPTISGHTVYNFGSSCTINDTGTVVFIGARGTIIPNLQGGNVSTGEVYAYVFKNNAWVYLTQITPQITIGPGAQFGNAVATNTEGSALIVGAYQAASYTGNAFIVN